MEGVKEYLVKNVNGSYSHDNAPLLPWGETYAIEIPEGAEVACYYSGSQAVEFYKKGFFFNYHDREWQNSSLGPRSQIIWQRQEKPLEYLDPSDWSLKFIRGTDDAAPENWILVPEVAVIYFQWNQHPANAKFHDKDGNIVGDDARVIPWTIDGLLKWGSDVLWQRHTLPDDLPFIDDHPPAHFVVRPKPRVRAYAVMGRRVISHIEIKIEVSA